LKGSNKSSAFFIFIVLLGSICGSLIGDLIGSNIKVLSFLKSVYFIGMNKPLVLDLKVISLSFAINFNINLMSIIGIIVAIILYRKF